MTGLGIGMVAGGALCMMMGAQGRTTTASVW